MFTFRKKDRLISPIDIQKVRTEGESFYLFPFKTYFLSKEDQECSRVVFSVPKKIFKRAVVRNLLKRRAKEAYRLNKPIEGISHDVLFVYSHNQIVDYGRVEKSIKGHLQKIFGNN